MAYAVRRVSDVEYRYPTRHIGSRSVYGWFDRTIHRPNAARYVQSTAYGARSLDAVSISAAYAR